MVIIWSLQSRQYEKAPGPKCYTGVSNNETQTVLCFSEHSTGHYTGNKVLLLPLTGGKVSLLSQSILSVIRMESFPDGRLVCLAERPDYIQCWSQTINTWWMSLCPSGVGSSRSSHTGQPMEQPGDYPRTANQRKGNARCRLVFHRDNERSLPPDWEGCNLLHREGQVHLLACQQPGDRWSFMH